MIMRFVLTIATALVLYALEVNKGWFGCNGFESGDRVEIPDSVQAFTVRERGRAKPTIRPGFA